MDYKGPERRATPRKDVKLEIKYLMHVDMRKGKTQLDTTMTLNIGGGGLCIYSDIPYPAGSDCLLVVSLPELSEAIVTNSKIIHVNEVNEGPGKKYKIGIQYINIDKGDLQLIMDFVARK